MVNGFRLVAARRRPALGWVWAGLLVPAALLVGCAASRGADGSTGAAPVAAAPPVGGPASVQSPVQEKVAVEFRRLQVGALGPHVERGAYLATTEAEWKALWSRLFGGGEPAGVDFRREVAVMVAQGEQRTGGYWVKVVGAAWDGSTLRLRVEEGRPGPGAIVTMALTYPYDAVAVTRPGPGQPVGGPVDVQWVPAK